MTQIWLVGPFTQVKSAEHMAKIFQHKSQVRVLKPISKCIQHSQMRNFLDYRVQNVPENSSKLRCLVAFQNKQSAPIGRDKNSVYFKFLEGQFYKAGKAFLCQLEEN